MTATSASDPSGAQYYFECVTGVNFDNFVIESYGGDQDQNPLISIEDNGFTLQITANGWKRIYLPYTITPNTILEFDFKSSVAGEIHGIGFDDDNTINNPIRTFQLYGTQSWGIPDFNDYQSSAPNWKHYSIPVGQFYTGEMLYLTFTNDHDAALQDGESFFSNVRVFEDTTGACQDSGWQDHGKFVLIPKGTSS
jgi:hypothetical protein